MATKLFIHSIVKMY